MAVFTLFRDPVLIVASEEEKYGGCPSSGLFLPAPPPLLLHAIWVDSPQAAILKALPLGYATLLSPGMLPAPFPHSGFLWLPPSSYQKRKLTFKAQTHCELLLFLQSISL